VSEQALFVYFRVARADEAAVVSAVRRLQAAWTAEWPGLSCELLRRCDDAAEATTLMEIYRGLSDGQRLRIEADATRALSVWPIGPRHVEVFEACGPV
jgi:hypothetical protein